MAMENLAEKMEILAEKMEIFDEKMNKFTEILSKILSPMVMENEKKKFTEVLSQVPKRRRLRFVNEEGIFIHDTIILKPISNSEIYDKLLPMLTHWVRNNHIVEMCTYPKIFIQEGVLPDPSSFRMRADQPVSHIHLVECKNNTINVYMVETTDYRYLIGIIEKEREKEGKWDDEPDEFF